MSDAQRTDNDLSRVYSEGAWPEPRRQIDEAILLAARRAARARHPVLHRWGPPFALAATVLVGVSLAVLVTEHQSVRDMRDYFRPREPAPMPAPQKKRDAAPAAKSEATPKVDTAPAPRELFASPMGPDHRPPEAKPAAPAAKGVSPAAKAPAPLAKAAPAPKAPAPAAKSPAPLARPAPPAAKAALPSSRPAADPQRVQRELEQLQQNREARAAAPAAVPAAPSAATSASVSDLRGLAAAPGAVRSPESWLDDIRRLRTQGRTADAERELAEFRKRYPDFHVPEDLR